MYVRKWRSMRSETLVHTLRRFITMKIKSVTIAFAFPLWCLTALCNGQEEQVRMTMLLKGQFNSESPNSEYQCYLSEPERAATVQSFRAVNTRNTKKWNINNPDPPRPTRDSRAYPHWKVELEHSRNNSFGVFGCRANKPGRRPTHVTGVFMRSDADFIPLDGLFTQTVDIGKSDVSIVMSQRRSNPQRPPRWIKDGFLSKDNPNHGRATYILGHPANTNDAAAYGCFLNFERDDARHGIQLLIVRACPEGTWGSRCSGFCGDCYNGGICDEISGKCICAPGFKGDECQTACGGNKFGHNCEFQCSETDMPNRCRNYLFCLVHPFGCRCNTGWKGLNCNEPCDQGTYGASCLQTCHCQSGQCNRYTGFCTGSTGCTDGWRGTNCQQVCGAGTFGANCRETCHCLSGQCHSESGECTGRQRGCTRGWRGSSCHEVCGAGRFGANCRETCHCLSGQCHSESGECTGRPTGCTSGWRGSNCQEVCGAGRFGANCRETCHCLSGQCERDSGQCTGRPTGCTSGWRGSSCHEVCGAGTFGTNCRETCHCLSGQCHSASGECTGRQRGCTSGWRGSNCQEALLTSAPEEVTKGSLSITISWPAWNGNTNARDPPVIGYIPYHKTSATEWIPGSSDTVQTLQFTFSELTPDTNYSFSVSVVIEGNEEGPKSPELVVKTTCEVPSSPTNLTLEPFEGEQDRLTISWQMPSSQDIRCSSGVTQLTLYYSNNKEPGSEMSEDIIDVSNTSYTFNVSLKEGEYTFQLSMTTAGGESNKSKAIYHSIAGGAKTFDNGSGNKDMNEATYIIIGIVISLTMVVLLLVIIYKVHSNKEGGLSTCEKICKFGDKPSSKNSGSVSVRKSALSGAHGRVDISFPSLNVNEEPIMEDRNEDMDMSCEAADPVYGNVNKPVPFLVADLERYINKCYRSKTGSFEAQFQLFKAGKQYAADVGEKEENKIKNRFKNMIAYDHSRVMLERLEEDPHSDYFNANYIENAFGALSFIASQGPNNASLVDFWRMIWQDNVTNIVMLTNLIEKGKIRCKQYWPVAVGTLQCFGEYQVTWQSKENYADYVIRYLSVEYAGATRQVKNWHFETWPDMDVPHQATPLIGLANKVKLYQVTSDGPLLVHCSAGVGRTGTFIGLYSLMDVIQTRLRIDIFGYVEQMRQSRIMMVQTAAQFRFLHECLLEFSLSGDTVISAKDMASFSIHDNREKLVREYSLLAKFDKKLKKANEVLPEEAEKSRFPSMLPFESKRPFIESQSNSQSSNFINACFTSSLTKKEAFIATQSPLPATVEDFWSLIYGWKCPLIVMLNPLNPNDESCCQYWTDSCPFEVGHMTLELTFQENKGFYVHRMFKISHSYEKRVMKVHHMQLKSWDEENLFDITRLIYEMDTLLDGIAAKGLPVVHCIDGVGRTGIFLVTKSEMERLKLENRVDVFSTVRQLRGSNQHFIPTQDDYDLCHLLLKVDSPEPTYGNI
ncbi:uncharacterized protein [Apostichopus japonicus]|uniref:uncharacterized protein isoform X4 n=1 Tax=Stichopus japonicus TaxID=307972 RepID=UPI003AB8B709